MRGYCGPLQLLGKRPRHFGEIAASSMKSTAEAVLKMAILGYMGAKGRICGSLSVFRLTDALSPDRNIRRSELPTGDDAPAREFFDGLRDMIPQVLGHDGRRRC